MISLPHSQRVGVVGVGLVHRLILGKSARQILFEHELIDERLSEAAIVGSDGHSLGQPGPRLGRPALRRQVLREPCNGVDVRRVFLEPLLVVLGQPGQVVVAQEHFFDAPAHVAIEPAVGVQLAQQLLEIDQGIRGLFQLHFQVGHIHAQGRLPVLVVRLVRQFLHARQRLRELPFFDQRRGDLFLHTRIVG